MKQMNERILPVCAHLMRRTKASLATTLVAGVAAAFMTPAAAQHTKPAAPDNEPVYLSEPSIVGGREIRPAEWRRNYKWIVTMVPSGSPNTLRCGGSLIDREWVLTAAHCIEGLVPSDIQIRVNSRTLSGVGRIVDVEGIIPHPDYNPVTFDSDVALIKLAERVGNLPNIMMATRSDTNTYASARSRGEILGWGAIREGGPTSDILKIARVPFRSNAQCDRLYGGGITRNMICAAPLNGGTDACQGDSGGPLIVEDSDGNFKLVGLTSFGRGCARPGFPGVYTRVAAFRAWVNQTINGRSTCYIDDLAPQIRTPNNFSCFGLAANDDSSTNAVPIGFPVNFGGTTFTTLHVNNNGNLTFANGLSVFTPAVALEDLGLPIIAPFFADVDTRAAGSQIVYYGQATINGRRAFMAIWQRVGYFSLKRDKLNTFQVVLIESDPGSGNFTLEFNYDQIQWETGDASDGVDGLGGFSARAGWAAVGPNQNTKELRGSAVNGAYLDGGRRALSEHGNRGQIGRHSYRFRNGVGRGPQAPLGG